MSEKHTLQGLHRVGGLIRDAGGRSVATVWGEGISTAQQVAIADLFVAAPDLLAACKEAENWISEALSEMTFSYDEDWTILEGLRAALAKTEGKGEA